MAWTKSTTPKQDFSVNSVVRIGFLSLRVKASIVTPNNGPTVYFLANLDETKFFQFQPYVGLESITVDQAIERVTEYRKALEAAAAARTTKAAQQAQARAKFAEVFAVAS